MTRRQARENAFIALYEFSFEANTLAEIIENSQQTEYAVDTYGQKLLADYTQYAAAVDNLIAEKLKNWTMDRLLRVNTAILRLAVTEMLFTSDGDMDSVVINEAVELAKKYANEQDYQFINGVLGAINRDKTEQPEA